jgi:hypothetical protein
MLNTRIVTVAAALLCAANLVRAQEAPAGSSEKTFTPVFKYTVGELLTYSMKMTMKMEMKGEQGDLPLPGGENVMSGKAKLKTVKVKPDGTGVVHYTMSNFSMQMMGQTMQMPEMPPVTMEMDSRGRTKVVNAPAAQGNPMMGQFMNMQQGPNSGIILPDRPIKVGDTWETEVDVPGVAGQKAKATCKLAAVEQVGGQEALRIEQVMEGPMDMLVGPNGQPTTDAASAMMSMKGTFSVNSVSHVLEKNGRLLKSSGEMKLDMVMEMKGDAAAQSPFGSKMNMKMDGKMSTDLVSATMVNPSAQTKPAAAKTSAGTGAKKPAAPSKTSPTKKR